MTFSVFDRVTGWRRHQRDKHDLGADYVEESVNETSQYELLREISDAVSEMIEELRSNR